MRNRNPSLDHFCAKAGVGGRQAAESYQRRLMNERLQASEPPGEKAGANVILPHQIGWPAGFPTELASGLGRQVWSPCRTKREKMGIFKKEGLQRRLCEQQMRRPHQRVCSFGSKKESEIADRAEGPPQREGGWILRGSRASVGSSV